MAIKMETMTTFRFLLKFAFGNPRN